MVLPLTRLNSMGYDNKPDNTWENYYYAQAFPEESSLQREGNVPFYCGPVLQRGMDSKLFSKVLLEVSCSH